VHWVLKRDHKDEFRFVAQQSEQGQRLIAEHRLSDQGNTVWMIHPNGNCFEKSDVIFEVFRVWGGGYRLLMVFKWVPRIVRNGLYDWIARNRYRWFGKKEDACEIPPTGIRHKFL